jgi:hypothetical protein
MPAEAMLMSRDEENSFRPGPGRSGYDGAAATSASADTSPAPSGVGGGIE